MQNRASIWFEIWWVSTKLGLTSFGGPTAHLAYFHDEYVKRRKWLDERSYADLVALCQFLPGPASSQTGIGIGLMRGGLIGGLLSFLGFTWPSAIALGLFAWLMDGMDVSQAGWLHGLKLVAVAIVAHAILGMGQKLTPDRTRISIAIAAAAVSMLWESVYSQIIVIVLAGLLGMWLYRKKEAAPESTTLSTDESVSSSPVSRRIAIVSLALFAVLLILLPFLRESAALLAMADSFYRTGSLVFGGGHVVLPLLENEVVRTGWVSEEQFLAGYGAAQAVPGPLFTFASFLGAAAYGPLGFLIATAAIFLPAYLLVVGVLPFWHRLRSFPKAQSALHAVNAAVVGILLAAFYDPIWTSAVVTPIDFTLALVLFVLLAFWKLPPWVIVLIGAAAGTVTGM